jgi:hypothetical protein
MFFRLFDYENKKRLVVVKMKPYIAKTQWPSETNMNNINPMVTTIVQEIMIAENDPSTWRQELIRNQIFNAKEARDLTEREISLIHQALLVQQFSKLSSDELMSQANKYNLQYHIQFEEDQLQMGAICY